MTQSAPAAITSLAIDQKLTRGDLSRGLWTTFYDFRVGL